MHKADAGCIHMCVQPGLSGGQIQAGGLGPPDEAGRGCGDEGYVVRLKASKRKERCEHVNRGMGERGKCCNEASTRAACWMRVVKPIIVLPHRDQTKAVCGMVCGERWRRWWTHAISAEGSTSVLSLLAPCLSSRGVVMLVVVLLLQGWVPHVQAHPQNLG